MDSIFERMKRRTEQFGGLFKGILSPRDSNFPGNSDTTATKVPQSIQLTDDIYDDTGVLGKNAKGVLDWNNRHPQPQRSSKAGVQEIHPLFPSEGSIFPPPAPGHGPESSMLGRTVLGMFESAFGMMEEIDNAMRDMDAAFSQFDKFMDDEDDDHRYSRFFGQGFPLHEMDLDNSTEDNNTEINPNNFIDPNANYRDQMLKPEGDTSAKKLVEPRTSPSSPAPSSRSWHWESSSSTMQTYSSVNGKVQSQIIRDTPEGREIITQRQNGQGVTEEHREFIPRKDLPEQSIFTKIFRPKF